MSPEAFAKDYIKRWEGGLSLDKNDAGNWSTGQKGRGAFIGSKYGVTGRTLSAFRNKQSVTAAEMAALSLDEATKIALKLFYTDPGLDRLAWNRVTASVLDFGWGAGPTTSVKLLQDLLDTPSDGNIGPVTSQAYSRFLGKTEVFAAGAWWAMREDYYERLVERRPSDGIYLKGWDNRSRYFTPGDAEGWWRKWE